MKEYGRCRLPRKALIGFVSSWSVERCIGVSSRIRSQSLASGMRMDACKHRGYVVHIFRRISQVCWRSFTTLLSSVNNTGLDASQMWSCTLSVMAGFDLDFRLPAPGAPCGAGVASPIMDAAVEGFVLD